MELRYIVVVGLVKLRVYIGIELVTRVHRNRAITRVLFYAFMLLDHLCNIDVTLSERVELDRGA